MDFGPSARDYALHRKTFPDSFFEEVPLRGDLLDLGAGTGALARGYARRGARVVALDRSRATIEESFPVEAGEKLVFRIQADLPVDPAEHDTLANRPRVLRGVETRVLEGSGEGLPVR